MRQFNRAKTSSLLVLGVLALVALLAPVAPGQWVKFLAPDNFMTLSPPPRRILSVQIGASGWDYESLVTNVSLVGR